MVVLEKYYKKEKSYDDRSLLFSQSLYTVFLQNQKKGWEPYIPEQTIEHGKNSNTEEDGGSLLK